MPIMSFEEAKATHFRFFYDCFSNENWQSLYGSKIANKDLPEYIHSLINNNYLNFHVIVYSATANGPEGFTLFYLDSNHELFGNVGVSPQYIRKGIGVPITVHSIFYALNYYDNQLIYCNIAKCNTMSLRLMQRIGFVIVHENVADESYRLTLSRQDFNNNTFNKAILTRYSFFENIVKE